MNGECFQAVGRRFDRLEALSCQQRRCFHIQIFQVVQSFEQFHERRIVEARYESKFKTFQGLDTVDANLSLGLPVDGREWEDAIDILQTLGLREFTLLTNNPEKVASLISSGFAVKRENVETHINIHNKKYLKTKSERLGHLRKVE